MKGLLKTWLLVALILNNQVYLNIVGWGETIIGCVYIRLVMFDLIRPCSHSIVEFLSGPVKFKETCWCICWEALRCKSYLLCLMLCSLHKSSSLWVTIRVHCQHKSCKKLSFCQTINNAKLLCFLDVKNTKNGLVHFFSLFVINQLAQSFSCMRRIVFATDVQGKLWWFFFLLLKLLLCYPCGLVAVWPLFWAMPSSHHV